MAETLEAVIEIGSTGIRLCVAEISAKGEWSVIDYSELPIAFGWDVFTSGRISRDSLLQCLRVLYRFKEQLAGWAIGDGHIAVLGTSALREAHNRDLILDRILVKTGFRITVIDGIEENRLMYLAVMSALKEQLPKLKKLNSVIIEVGGGSTELMLLDHGKIAAAHSLRLGTVIIEHQIKSMMGTQKDTRRFLEEFIRNTGGNLNAELNLGRVKRFIAVGAEALLAAQMVGSQVSEKLWVIQRKDFDGFVEENQKLSIEECIARYKVSYRDARSLNIHLLTCKLFVDLTRSEEILVPVTSLREGYIIGKISAPNPKLQKDFANQIFASALNVSRKYRIDEAHSQHVCKTALTLFDRLRTELGLTDNARRLLAVAALLHDVGMFIRGADHQLHSFYIISNSEIFGLSKDNILIISQVARYHRGPCPTHTDTAFVALSRETRTAVVKLAALLRVADALDRGHAQRIQDFDIELTGENLILNVKGTHDITLEKTAITEKGDLFEAVFGYTILLT